MTEDYSESDSAADASMRARLDSVLGDARMPTGAFTARILHDLFLSEVRQCGRYAAEQAWNGLNASAIVTLGKEFAEHITHPTCSDYFLPAGTWMAVGMYGIAMIGSEELGLDVDQPGLTHQRDLPTRPGGSNLARLLAGIEALTLQLPCRAVGMPTLVDRFCDRHPEHHLRFPPFAPAGGVVLTRAMDFTHWGEFFCAFTADEIDALAERVVDDIQRLWNNGSAYAPLVRSIRRAATRVVRQLQDVRVHAVTLDISNQFSGGDQFAVEFEAWDHSFRRGIVVQQIGLPRNGKIVLHTAGLDRAGEVEAVQALGADGRISVLARAIAEAAPQGAAAVLNDLATEFETFVTLDTRTSPVQLRLFWQHGEIGAATYGGHKIDVSRDAVTLHRETLPDTLILSLPGQPVLAIFDQPFRCEARIAQVENYRESVVVTPEPDPWLVNCRTGRMWPNVTLPSPHAAIA